MPRDGSIRKASHGDIDLLWELEKRCFPGEIAYSKRQIKHLALLGNTVCLVDDPGDGIRGFVVATFRDGSTVAGIETIDVHPEHRGKGVGKALLEAAEHEMRRRGASRSRLEVSEGNHAAKTLYEKSGYVPLERIPNYYNFEHDGSRHAVRMVKKLQ